MARCLFLGENKTMRILCIGDVVGERGLRFYASHVSALKNKYNVDFTIVNGENSAPTGTGIIKPGLNSLLTYADCVTTGNHSFRQRGWETLYDDEPFLLRTENMMNGVVGHGIQTISHGKYTIRVINLIGLTFMGFSSRNPYDVMDQILKESEPVNATIVDFHGEATSEKQAFAWNYDGRISAVFGTHTHVPTADARVLPKGTGFIADVGMTGPYQSILGVVPSLAIRKMRYTVPTRFSVAEGPCELDAVVFDIDPSNGLCTGVEQVIIRE